MSLWRELLSHQDCSFSVEASPGTGPNGVLEVNRSGGTGDRYLDYVAALTIALAQCDCADGRIPIISAIVDIFDLRLTWVVYKKGEVVQEENSIGKYLMVAVLIGGAFFFYNGSPKEAPLPKDSEFVSRVTNSGPVIVKFGAEWCPPCRHVEYELNELTRIYGNRVRVVKIDIDAQPELARHYRIGSIPHLMLFQYGKQIKELKGSRTAEELALWAGIK